MSSSVLRDTLGGNSGIFTAITRECHDNRVTLIESSSHSKVAYALVDKIVKGASQTEPGDTTRRDRYVPSEVLLQKLWGLYKLMYIGAGHTEQQAKDAFMDHLRLTLMSVVNPPLWYVVPGTRATRVGGISIHIIRESLVDARVDIMMRGPMAINPMSVSKASHPMIEDGVFIRAQQQMVDEMSAYIKHAADMCLYKLPLRFVPQSMVSRHAIDPGGNIAQDMDEEDGDGL